MLVETDWLPVAQQYVQEEYLDQGKEVSSGRCYCHSPLGAKLTWGVVGLSIIEERLFYMHVIGLYRGYRPMMRKHIAACAGSHTLHYSLQAFFDEAVADSRKRSARMLSDQGIHVLGMESRQSGSRYIRPHACDYICLYDSQLPTRHRGTDGTDGTDDTYFGKTSRRYDT